MIVFLLCLWFLNIVQLVEPWQKAIDTVIIVGVGGMMHAIEAKVVEDVEEEV